MKINLMSKKSINFHFLNDYDPALEKLGWSAERLLFIDSNACLIKIRQFGELLARRIAKELNAGFWRDTSFFEILQYLDNSPLINSEVVDKFHQIRVTGNEATHKLEDGSGIASRNLRLAWELGVWFHFKFMGNDELQATHFILPKDVEEEKQELLDEINELQERLELKEEEHEELRELNAKRISLYSSQSEELNRIQKDLEACLEVLPVFFKFIQNTDEYRELAHKLKCKPNMTETFYEIRLLNSTEEYSKAAKEVPRGLSEGETETHGKLEVEEGGDESRIGSGLFQLLLICFGILVTIVILKRLA